MSYSINRTDSLNESLIDRSSMLTGAARNTQALSVKSAAKRDTVAKAKNSENGPNTLGIDDPNRKNIAFNDYTDMRTVLDNFLSQPGRFKYNRD